MTRVRLALVVAILAAPSVASAVDRPATAFTLPDVDGKKFDLKPHLGKDVVVVNFFATWCTPCQAELPALQQLQEKYADKGLTIAVISIDDPKSVSGVKPLVKEHHWTFPVLLDTDTKVASTYNPKKTVPFTSVIDKNGNVVSEHMGYKPGDEKSLEDELVKLLGPAAPATK